tara:strand:- start:66 stop:794 length:729 start_codon:yes stop_codon:yes gene_type:complete
MFENKEGQKVPQVTFQVRENDEWKKWSSEDLFKGKKVILFALPGAFTPTCSSSHLPRYNQLAPVFKQKGIDEIICLSVNDTFVMNAWAEDQESDNIRLLPDGNGEFSEKMGLLVDKNDLGFGKRSWRYSMYVEDGVIKKMFIEPLKDGDPFEVSDADTMLEYLDPKAKKPEAVSIITKPGCPHCKKAKELLDSKGIAFEEIILGTDATSVSLSAITGRNTVPQVFIAGKHIGGAEDLEKHLN